jgi:hypothetical protein
MYDPRLAIVPRKLLPLLLLLHEGIVAFVVLGEIFAAFLA